MRAGLGIVSVIVNRCFTVCRRLTFIRIQLLDRLNALADPANKKATMIVRDQLLNLQEALLDVTDNVDDAQLSLKKAKRRNRNVEQKEHTLHVCGPFFSRPAFWLMCFTAAHAHILALAITSTSMITESRRTCTPPARTSSCHARFVSRADRELIP